MLNMPHTSLMTEELLTLSDVARALGISRQALYKRRGVEQPQLPDPDYETPSGASLWKRTTLEKASILKPSC